MKKSPDPGPGLGFQTSPRDGKTELVPDQDIDYAIGSNRNKGKHQAFYESRDRRDAFLVAIKEGASLDEAVARVGVKRGTYNRWRDRYKDFAAKVDVARAGAKGADLEYKGGFAKFRQTYLGNPSTWFQQRFVSALEECGEGEIIMVLWPPEHGKTTTIEDFLNYKFATDPNSRITVVSERQDHAKRIVRRVRERMEQDGPSREMVLRFGPFQPQRGERAHKQKWTDTALDVWKRGTEHFDERDFNLQAVGLGTTIQGVRCDWMILDDIQGIKSINQTPQYVEVIRQDFLSRPGMFGRVVFCGTRVADFDVYQKLIDEELIDRMILFPAVNTHTGEWLWPERYTETQYLKAKKRVGDQAWARNWLQRPTAVKDQAYARDIMLTCADRTLTTVADPRRDPAREGMIVPVVLSVDPSLGNKNVTWACAHHDRTLQLLSYTVDEGLQRTDQIFDRMEEYIHRFNIPGVSQVHEVVIESVAFQRGLLTDQRARELERRFGIRIVPHQTQMNKHDPDYGVAAMALSFARQEMSFPYGDDLSIELFDAFIAEACAWRPSRRGNRLVQDILMALWFNWKRWKEQGRMAPRQNTAGWHTAQSILREVG